MAFKSTRGNFLPSIQLPWRRQKLIAKDTSIFPPIIRMVPLEIPTWAGLWRDALWWPSFLVLCSVVIVALLVYSVGLCRQMGRRLVGHHMYPDVLIEQVYGASLFSISCLMFMIFSAMSHQLSYLFLRSIELHRAVEVVGDENADRNKRDWYCHFNSELQPWDEQAADVVEYVEWEAKKRASAERKSGKTEQKRKRAKRLGKPWQMMSVVKRGLARRPRQGMNDAMAKLLPRKSATR
ncbi:unnamed protein product, partial [Mesorhabditis spiculigera]